jgi:hypothetical protein
LKDLYCVVLKPSPNPEMPPPGPLFTSGWYGEQDSPSGERDHLARGNEATLILTNTTSAPVDKYASFIIASLAPRTVTIQGAGAYQSWHVDQQHAVRAPNMRLTLAPGENRITFGTDAPATQGQMGLMTFDVANFDLNDSPLPEQ